jgi:hypothetical protein
MADLQQSAHGATMTIAKTLGAVALVALASGCARGLYGPSVETPVGAAPRELDELSVRERAALLDRAQVWRPIETARLDLLEGPRGRDAFPFDAQVTCGFHYPSEPLTGATPKFECKVTPEDIVKVKYGEDNGEVFAEVAATRLFWALGFAADRMYPVKVTCLNCPANPHQVSAAEWHLGKPGTVATRVYDPATIERKFRGESIETKGYEGWSWQELERVADNSVGAPRAHVDALKLLAAFVQHVDSKPDNQSLVCLDSQSRTDRQGNATCAQPMAMVKDLGSTFAAASKVTFPKMKLESWRNVKVWRDEKTCQANLTSSIVGTLEHPRVSEAGRRFLASRLRLLSDEQLTDLFTAARVDRRKDNIEGRQVTVADWVRAFKEKRAQIVDHRCQT